jgi:hypothetical protein
MTPVRNSATGAIAPALPGQGARRLPKLRDHLMASAMAAAIILGASPMAAAATILFNPDASNSGLLQLYSGQNAFSVTGGAGALYDNFSLPSSGTGSYTGDMVINLTSFAGASGTGINAAPGWELFAIVSLTGTDNHGTTGSPTFNIQLYGINTNQTFPPHGDNNSTTEGYVGFSNPGKSTTTVTANDVSATVTHLVNNGSSNDLNVGDRGATDVGGHNVGEYSGSLVEPDGTVGDANDSAPACIDGTTNVSGGTGIDYLNSSPSFTGSKANCILLAYGTQTGTASNLSINGTNETFSLDAVLTLAGYATGANGFFGSDPTTFDLTINSGASGEGIDAVTDPNTTYTANSGDLVNWDIPGTAVPEPGSLTLFGTALMGLGAMLRRKRK